jgi:hypothetical protein
MGTDIDIGFAEPCMFGDGEYGTDPSEYKIFNLMTTLESVPKCLSLEIMR